MLFFSITMQVKGGYRRQSFTIFLFNSHVFTFWTNIIQPCSCYFVSGFNCIKYILCMISNHHIIWCNCWLGRTKMWEATTCEKRVYTLYQVWIPCKRVLPRGWDQCTRKLIHDWISKGWGCCQTIGATRRLIYLTHV